MTYCLICSCLLMLIVRGKGAEIVVEEGQNASITFHYDFPCANSSFRARIIILQSLETLYEYEYPHDFARVIQEGRRTFVPNKSEHGININLTISNVTRKDRETYRFHMAPIGNCLAPPYIRDHYMRVVSRSMTKAKCRREETFYDDYLSQLYCESRLVHDRARTISCYRSPGAKAPFFQPLKYYEHNIDVIYWLDVEMPLWCCAHGLNEIRDISDCEDYYYNPPTKPIFHIDKQSTITHSSSSSTHKPTVRNMQDVPLDTTYERDISNRSNGKRIGSQCSLIVSLCLSVWLSLM